MPIWLLFKPKQVERGRGRDKIKIIFPISSNKTHNREFQKNSKKIQKIKKYHYEFISSQNTLEKDEKERNKYYRSVPFLPDA